MHRGILRQILRELVGKRLRSGDIAGDDVLLKPDWGGTVTTEARGGSGTAANGDEFSTSSTRSGVVVPPIITFTEFHTITGGSGRFADASGTFTVVQTRGLSMPYNNSATIDGTINLGH